MNKPQKFIMLLWVLVTFSSFIHAALIGTKIANVELTDGRKLKNFVIISVGDNSVAVKWDGGRGVISRSDLPNDLRAQLDTEYPKPAIEEPATPATPNISDKGSTENPATEPPLKYEDMPEAPALTEKQGRERSIAGQVFVTTAGGANIKLGGVPVWVYSAEDYKLQNEWFLKYPLQRVDIHFKRARYFTNTSQWEKNKVEMEMASLILNGAMTVMRKPSAATRTDADGKFTLRYQIDGPYVVVSMGSRQLSDEKERYRWAVKSEDITEPMNLLLDNSNMDNK